MEALKQLTTWGSQCNRCGFCQDVCPTYAASADEVQVARGRIRTIRMVIDQKFESVLGQGNPRQLPLGGSHRADSATG